MFHGWMSLGGTEIINSSRADAHARNMGLPGVRCDCTNLRTALGDAPYVLPDSPSNPAPWFDPAVEESRGLAGFVGLEFVGFSKGTGRRTRVNLITDGAVPGSLIMNEREILVRGIMLACNDCSLAYGISWLAGSLRGAICNQSCFGDELCVLTCCPSCTQGEEGCNANYSRRLYNVALIDGPEITQVRETSSSCCGQTGTGLAARFEFTLVAGWPWLHHDPTPVALNVITKGTHTRPASAGIVECNIPASCLDDPECPPPLVPPVAPFIPDECACGPVDQTGTIVTLPSGLLPEVYQKVPVLSVYAGSGDMRCVTIRFYNNPTGISCTSLVADPCAACTEINIPYIPAQSTFTFDGRTRQATVDCAGPGGIGNAVSKITGQGGKPFAWPVFDCSTAMCIEFLASTTSHPADGRLSLWMVSREDAA